MLDFWLNELEIDYFSNLKWVELIEENDLTSNQKIRPIVCHLINQHHILNQRFLNKNAESEAWDDLPFQYWEKFIQVNYLESKEILLGALKNEEMDAYHLIMQVIKHATYHKGQLALLVKEVDISPIDTSLIKLH